MKKVFISQPMRGKTETEILTERKRIIEEIRNMIGDHEVLDTYFDDFSMSFSLINPFLALSTNAL